VDDEGDERDDALAALEEASETLKGKIKMSYSGYKEGLGNRLADYIGVDGTSIPAVRIVNPDEGKITKYVLEGEITAASLIDFYEQYNEDKLQPFIKSEEIPDS
jgi:hypothetical protein